MSYPLKQFKFKKMRTNMKNEPPEKVGKHKGESRSTKKAMENQTSLGSLRFYPMFYNFVQFLTALYYVFTVLFTDVYSPTEAPPI